MKTLPSACRSALLLPVLAALAGCGDTSARAEWAGTVDTLAGGVVLVSNPATGIWGSDDGWRLVEELRIGSAMEEGPAMFGNVTAIQADDDGRIYVADAQAQEVRIFGPDGDHIRSFGRKGGGPGEFEQISGMGWGPDGNLWIMDARNARFAVFDPSGAHVTDHRKPGGFIMMPWPGGFDRAGGIYDVGMSPDPAGGFNTALIRYEYLGAAGIEPRDTFRIPRYEGNTFDHSDSSGRMRIRAGVPFAPGQSWRLSDGHIWMAITDRYRLHRLGFTGDTLRIVERAFTPPAVTAAERDSAMEAMSWFTDQGGSVDRSRVPDRKPAFRSLFEDGEGYLWIWPYVARGESQVLDIFDPDGRYLGAVPMPEGMSLMPSPVARGDRLYGIVRDDLEIQYVTRFRIEGRGGQRLARD